MIFSEKVYTLLKWLGAPVIPAIGAMYVSLAVLWALPYADAVAGTCLAVATFIGAITQYSNANYKKVQAEDALAAHEDQVNDTYDPKHDKVG